MLLVAQRVSSPGGRKIGINAFLYHHGADASARIDWKALDIEKVLQHDPGELVAELIEVAPGGNSVAAFLDVLAPDGTPKDLILGSLRQGADLLRQADDPVGSTVIRGRIALRLHAPGEARSSRRFTEYSELAEKVAQLLARPSHALWRVLSPLVVVASRHGEGWRFRVDPASAGRVRELLGQEWAPPSITVTDEVKAQLDTMHGDLMPHILPSLVGLSAESALALGGVEIMGPDGERLSAWPARTQTGTGYCLRCHRHNTLVAESAGLRCTECGNGQADNGLWVATLT